MEEENIKDLVKTNNALIKQLMEQKDQKKWNMPLSGKLSKGKVKKGYVTYFIIRNNRRIDIIKAAIDEGTTSIDGIPRIATTDHVLFDNKGNPIVIQPEWSQKPFSPEENYNKTIENGDASAGAKLLMNRMRRDILEQKKTGFSGGSWIIWVVVALAVAGGVYYLAGGKLF